MSNRDLERSRPKADVRHVLTRILDEPALVAEVRALPSAALAKLIDHVGLEDAGELVALATTEQIAGVFDSDLWTRDVPGEDEAFDAKRFVTWLEILLEAGERAAATRLAELDRDVLTFALHRLVLVLDVDELATDADDDVERAIESSNGHEIGEFLVISRQPNGWDAIIHALASLDEVDHDHCARILKRLSRMTEREAEEEGGYCELLSAAESLADDVRGDRDDRRAEAGFVAPADARAFLRLAREHDVEGDDAVTKAYFRELRREPVVAAAPTRLAKVVDELGPRTKKRLPSKPTPLARAIAALPPSEQIRCMEELAYLVNVLLAGDRYRWRPADAAEAVVAVIGDDFAALSREGLVPAFRRGVRQGKLDALTKNRRQ